MFECLSFMSALKILPPVMGQGGGFGAPRVHWGAVTVRGGPGD